MDSDPSLVNEAESYSDAWFATFLDSIQPQQTENEMAFVPRADRRAGMPGYVDTDQGDVAAKRVGGPRPRFPESLRRTGEDGWAIMGFIIDERGRAIDRSVEVLCQSHLAFGWEARTVVRRSRFTPAIINGVPTMVWVIQSVNFSIGR